MTERDNFSVCDDNWEQLRQVRDLAAQVKNMRLWFEADSKPDQAVLEAILHAEQAVSVLYSKLLTLQLSLISGL